MNLLVPIGNLLTRLGFSRDDLTWFWAQLVAGAGLVFSGLIDVPTVAAKVGLYITPTEVNWIMGACIMILWLGGKMSSSQLFGKGQVPK